MTKQYPMKYPLKNWRAVNMNWGIQILCHDAPNIVIAALSDSLEGPTRSPSVKAAGDLIASAPTLAAEVDRLRAENETMRAALAHIGSGEPGHWLTSEEMALAARAALAAGGDSAKTADFFDGLDKSTGLEPYEAFGKWAKEHGYDLDDDDQRGAAIEAYRAA